MLNLVILWLFFAPVAFFDVSVGIVNTFSLDQISYSADVLLFVTMIPIIALVLSGIFWGQACVLSVSKRMVASPAGRNRSSFKAIRTESYKYIWPLLFTSIVRTCTTFLLCLGAVLPIFMHDRGMISMPLAIVLAPILALPGILYFIRTAFYGIIIVTEKDNLYRSALKKSSEAVKGHFWEVVWRYIVITLIISVPAIVMQLLIAVPLITIDERLITLASVLADLVEAFALAFFILTMTAFYADIRESLS